MGKISKWMAKKSYKIRDNLLRSWSILFCVWMVDLISTAIALGIYPKDAFYELNPIAAAFFGIGIFGWFLWIGFVALLLLLLLQLPSMFLWMNSKRKLTIKQKKSIHLSADFLQLLCFYLIIFSETCVIIHNVSLLIWY